MREWQGMPPLHFRHTTMLSISLNNNKHHAPCTSHCTRACFYSTYIFLKGGHCSLHSLSLSTEGFKRSERTKRETVNQQPQLQPHPLSTRFQCVGNGVMWRESAAFPPPPCPILRPSPRIPPHPCTRPGGARPVPPPRTGRPGRGRRCRPWSRRGTPRRAGLSGRPAAPSHPRRRCTPPRRRTACPRNRLRSGRRRAP